MADRKTFYAKRFCYENIFAVPRQLWRSWGLDARAVFNETYMVMRDYPGLFNAKSTEAWMVISWNAACIAANAAERNCK